MTEETAVSKSLIEAQIQSLEAQLQVLKARLKQQPSSTPAAHTLGDLYGLLRGKAHSNDEDIRKSQIEWDWEEVKEDHE
jgi:hypothetical protein